MLNEQAFRTKFAKYFLLLKDSIEAQGGWVSKADEWEEWEECIRHLIDEGDLPPEAAAWKCPHNLNR